MFLKNFFSSEIALIIHQTSQAFKRCRARQWNRTRHVLNTIRYDTIETWTQKLNVVSLI